MDISQLLPKTHLNLVNNNAQLETEALSQVNTANIASLLAQNNVTGSDKAGAASVASLNFGDAPAITQPNTTNIAKGTSDLFGSNKAILLLLNVLLNIMEAERESSAISRAISTGQQNASESAAFQNVDTIKESAKKMKDMAIFNGAVGGAGMALGGIGLAGSFKKMKSTTLGGSSSKMGKFKTLRSKNADKLEKLTGKVFGSRSKIHNKAAKHAISVKSPSKMTSSAKYEKMDMASQFGTSVTSSIQGTTNSFVQSEQKRLEADGQTQNIVSERERTNKGKTEDIRDTMKRGTDAANRIMADILSSLTNTASAAARA